MRRGIQKNPYGFLEALDPNLLVDLEMHDAGVWEDGSAFHGSLAAVNMVRMEPEVLAVVKQR